MFGFLQILVSIIVGASILTPIIINYTNKENKKTNEEKEKPVKLNILLNEKNYIKTTVYENLLFLLIESFK